MYTLPFKKFLDPDYFPNDKIVLYVIRDKNMIFYIGISKVNVWYRWFGANGRMVKNVYDEWVSYDSIGNHIIRNMPKSLAWKIDLWSSSECNIFLGSTSEDLRNIESEMIAALLPKINYIGNSRTFTAEQNGNRLKEYLKYVKDNQQKIVKYHEIKEARKEIDFSEMVELLPEDDIPF